MSTKHTHKYKRRNIGGFVKENGKGKRKKFLVYHCTVPYCTHYIPIYMAEGQVASCPRCNEDFVIDKKAAKLAVPHCADCTTKKKDEVLSSTLDFIQDLEDDSN